jgi:hypothetical protein
MEQYEATTQEPSIGLGGVTVEDLKRMVSKLDQERLEYDKRRLHLQEQDAIVGELEGKLIATLEALNLKAFKGENGTVEVAYRTSVKLPQGEGKLQFFEYLKELGIFDTLASINSNTLNAWYKEEDKKAQTEKRLLRIPGLDMPTTTPILKLKRGG